MKADIAVVSRKVYLTEDEVSKTKERCEELEKGNLSLTLERIVCQPRRQYKNSKVKVTYFLNIK